MFTERENENNKHNLNEGEKYGLNFFKYVNMKLLEKYWIAVFVKNNLLLCMLGII